MQNQLTNISCIIGLVIIFVLAAIFQSHFRWLASVAALLIILIIRSFMIEVSQKTEKILTAISLSIVLITMVLMIADAP